MKIEIYHTDAFTGKTHAIQGSMFVSRGKFVVKSKTLNSLEQATFYLGISAPPESSRQYKIAVTTAREEFVKRWLEMSGLSTNFTSITMANAFEDFLKSHCANKMAKTREGYETAFDRIIPNAGIEVSQANIEQAVQYLLRNRAFKPRTNRDTSGQELSNSSINDYLRQFQVFVAWLGMRGLIDNINIYSLYKLKSDSKQVMIYNYDEIEKILSYFNDANNGNDFEYALLIEFMLNSGARIGEALKLRRESILDDRIIFGNKITKESEYIPISEKLRDILSKLPAEGKLWRWDSHSAPFLREKLIRAMLFCNIDPHGRCFHELRKTFLFRLFDKEPPTPVQYAQKLMRHRNIETTIKYYTYFEIDTLKKHMETTPKTDNNHTK